MDTAPTRMSSSRTRAGRRDLDTLMDSSHATYDSSKSLMEKEGFWRSDVERECINQ